LPLFALLTVPCCRKRCLQKFRRGDLNAQLSHLQANKDTDFGKSTVAKQGAV